MKTNPYLRLLLGNPRFRVFWYGETITFFANWFYYAALLGVVYSLFGPADREFAASLALLSGMIPSGFMVPFAGWIVDRFSRSRVLSFAKLLDMLLVVSLVLMHSTADARLIYLVNVILGCSIAVFFAARKAIVPDLVSEEDLYSANTLSNSTRGTMMVVGALAGGVVTNDLDPRIVFSIVAALHLFGGILFSRVHPRGRTTVAPRSTEQVSLVDQFRRGVDAIRGDTSVLWIIVLRAAVAAGLGMQILIAAFSEDVAMAGVLGIGILTAARGVGQIAGPFAGRMLSTRGHFDERRICALGVIVLGLGYGLLAPALHLPFGFAFASIAIGYTGYGAVEVLTNVAIQRRCRDAILGSVIAIDNGIEAIVKVIVILTIGAVVAKSTFAATTLISGLALVASGALWYLAVPRKLVDR